MSFATAAISGRLTRDPSTKEIGSGSVTSFTIACDQYNGKSNDKTPQFWDCECWSPAQSILQYFSKGDPISVSGQLRQNKGKKDEKRTFYSLRVEQIGTLPPKDSSNMNTVSDPEPDDPPF